MKTIIILGLIFNLSLNDTLTTDTLKMNTYSMEIPGGWKIKEGCTEENCSLLAPHDDYEDTFLENINIMIADAPAKDLPINKYTDFSIGYLPSVVTDFQLIRREKSESNSEFIIQCRLVKPKPQYFVIH